MTETTILSCSPVNRILPDHLANVLRESPNFRILEGDGTFSEMCHQLLSQNIDVILIKVDGLKTLQGVRDIYRNAKSGNIAIVCNAPCWQTVLEYMKAGVKGQIDYSISEKVLIKAINSIKNNELWFDRNTSSEILREFTSIQGEAKIDSLTKREKDVLHLVAKGWKNTEIAQSLSISESTVKTHLYSIYNKLNVRHRLDAALIVKQSEWGR